ncbi:MAG: hypothetical protein MJ206_03570 [Bacilli bacterium]|nr:hypothetical protein [Bacilli bacterium]
MIEDLQAKKKDLRIMNRLFRNVALVSIFSALIGALTSFTDGICASWVPHVGDIISGALAVVQPTLIFTGIFTTLFEIGIQILCSRRLAKGDKKGANQIFSMGIVLAVAVAIILALIFIFAADPITAICGATEENHKWAIQYMQGVFICAPLMCLYNVLMPIVNLEGDKRMNYLSTIAIFVVNVGGDVIGVQLFPDYAALALGVATSLSFAFGSLVLCTHFWIKKKGSVFHFSFKNFTLKPIGEFLLTAGPNCAKVVFIFGRNMIINIVLHGYGDLAFIAYSATNHITPFIECITSGLIAACLMLSSIFYGEEDRDSLNDLLKILFRWIFGIVLPLAVFYFFMAPVFATLYGVGIQPRNPVAFNEAVLAMRCDSITIPFVALNAPFLAIFQGTRRTQYAYIVTALQSFVLPSTLLLALGQTIPVDHSVTCWPIWVGITAGFVSYSIIHFSYCWIRARHIGFDVDTLFMLPKEFGCTAEQQTHITITNVAEASMVSQQVVDFCHKQGVDERRTSHLAACAEEFAMMMVMSGFIRDTNKRQAKIKKISERIQRVSDRTAKQKAEKQKTTLRERMGNRRLDSLRERLQQIRHHTCEMRVVYKDDELILRIRDDCPKFKIGEKTDRIAQSGDSTKNMAIRIIMGLAKDVEYVNMLKVNNLIIKV